MAEYSLQESAKYLHKLANKVHPGDSISIEVLYRQDKGKLEHRWVARIGVGETMSLNGAMSSHFGEFADTPGQAIEHMIAVYKNNVQQLLEASQAEVGRLKKLLESH